MSDDEGNGGGGWQGGRRKLPPHALFVVGSDTSEAAAESMSGHLARLESIVLDAVIARGTDGATCDELEAALDLRHQTCSARVNALAECGAILDCGGRRKTRSNRRAAVYVAAGHVTEELLVRAAEARDRKRAAAKAKVPRAALVRRIVQLEAQRDATLADREAIFEEVLSALQQQFDLWAEQSAGRVAASDCIAAVKALKGRK